jgi:dolichol-phosphate mannosyltransferase
VFLAADLQTPLALLPAMIDLCRQGRDVVWGSYESNEAQDRGERLTSRLFHAIMQRISSVGELPFQPGFAMLSRRAYTNLVRNSSQRASLIVEIPRLGYSTATLTYKKPRRFAGTSKWTLSRKLLAFVDAIVASSYLPLRVMAAIGMSVSLLGFGYAVLLVGMSLLGGGSPLGWRSLMVVVLILGGLQMLMLGIIGEYLWRVTETASRRALYLIEDSSGLPARDDIIQ